MEETFTSIKAHQACCMSVLDADHGCVPLSRCPTAPQQAPMAPISPYQAPRHHGDLQPSTPRLLNPINSGPRTCVFFRSRPNPGTLVLQGPASRSLIHSLFLQPESARTTRELPPCGLRIYGRQSCQLCWVSRPRVLHAPAPEPRYDHSMQSSGSSSSCITPLSADVEKKPLIPPHA